MEIISKNSDMLLEIGRIIGENITKETIILLDGPLGAGKTHLTKGIGLGLNIKETINSPTFTIAKEYFGSKTLNHFDVYRLEGLDEDIGISDYLANNSVVVIEWSKFIDTSIFDEFLHIEIEYYDDMRKLVFTCNGSYYEDLVKKVVKCII